MPIRATAIVRWVWDAWACHTNDDREGFVNKCGALTLLWAIRATFALPLAARDFSLLVL